MTLVYTMEHGPIKEEEKKSLITDSKNEPYLCDDLLPTTIDQGCHMILSADRNKNYH